MAGITKFLRELYLRLLIWLGAAPPQGYEHLMPAAKTRQAAKRRPAVKAKKQAQPKTPTLEKILPKPPVVPVKPVKGPVAEPEPFVEPEKVAPAEPPELLGTEKISEPVLEEVTLPPLEPEEPAPVKPEPLPSARLPRPPEGEFRYEVQRGDTLNAIARRYGITVKALVEANDIPDSSMIFPGQKLTIPGYLSPVAKPETEVVVAPAGDDLSHTVASGETLSSIAKRYGLTLRQLVEANHIREPNLVGVGQKLVIPRLGHRPEPAVAPPFPAGQIEADFPRLGSPAAVRAVYLSYFALEQHDHRRHIFDLVATTELNAVVIDVKGDHGYLSYPSQNPTAREIGAVVPTANDFDTLLAEFKARGVYTIARIVTFKDTLFVKKYPNFAVKVGERGEIWQDRDQSGWADPFLKPVWDYNLQLAQEAAAKGFDEIQFDYVRFPLPNHADPLRFAQEISKEARVAAVTGFLSMAHGQLKPLGVKIAANTFGYTCWRQDDSQIGQDIERLGQYLDVLCPMLYPSTFGSGIPGYKLAVAHPYEIVYESTRRAVERVKRFGCEVRPWIQDFPDYRFDQRVYGRAEIQAQIKGCFAGGGSGFLVWNPAVTYTRAAYAPLKQPVSPA